MKETPLFKGDRVRLTVGKLVLKRFGIADPKSVCPAVVDEVRIGNWVNCRLVGSETEDMPTAVLSTGYYVPTRYLRRS